MPIVQRCLGKDENYDLRIDAAVVSLEVGRG